MRKQKLKASLNDKLTPKQKFSLLSAGLSLVLVGTFAINQQIGLFDKMIEQTSWSRGVASHLSLGSTGPDKELSIKLARELNENPERDRASVGRDASPLERLAIEEFGGKYSFVLDAGCLKEIQFSENQGLSEQPKQISDIKVFVAQNQELFCQPEFSHVELKPVQEKDQFSYQRVVLLSKNNKTLSEVEVKVDANDGFLGLKVVR